MSNLTPQTWAATLLRALHIHQTPGAVRGLAGWAKAEGGNWNNNAKYNPLNTTQGAAGARSINSVGVKAYGSLDQGLNATVETLQNGRYEPILRALKSGNANAVGRAIGQTPWGTNAALARSAIASTPEVAGIHALGVGGTGPERGTSAGSGTTTTRTTEFDQAGYEKARRLAILGNYLAQRNPDDPLVKAGIATPGALPDKADFTNTSTKIAHSALTSHITSKGYSDTTAQLIARANRLDAKHFPYQWGGGHAGKAPAGSVPVDCSGAVSQVLGIDPRVASQFKTFGKPGRGRVTIYAKDTHVLMEINGHFFGTSASNPGGGAGWIPRSAISPEYLKGFTARHIDA